MTFPSKVLAVIDQREKEPYDLSPELNCHVALLPTGDYSLVGRESAVCVERKTVDDYVDTIINRRDRFYDQLARMTKMRHSIIVVEGTWERIVAGEYKTRAHVNTVLAITMAIQHKWKIPVHFAGNRAYGRQYTIEFLRRAWGWVG